ncbi:Flp family type IVb pilin [Ideonella sp.]|uniref:Flp family type IVb pilin n=1 Tax=Ideonella sp. TaxID=1929293 RepID=UPI003BB5A06C
MKQFNAPIRRVRGQGMTEYIIIVALIAVAAIGVYNLFGKTIRQQTSAMALGLAGNAGEANNQVKAAGTSATAAQTDANNTKNLSDFTESTKKQ